ncbi:MAG TPA: helix-turn-helix domain-containing protein [Usitatibacter sp.]|nr:helix-turn-helix domain-containing protein [Usitatibacter sp.]
MLAAAEQLFYEEGIGSVGIDRIIERAGVAKASLYDVFGSKDELVRSYLAGRLERRKARLAERLARLRTPRERLLGVFDALADFIAEPGFRGCPFVRASTQTKDSSSARQVCVESREWTLELFHELAREAGAAHPKKLARQLVLLYDGAITSAQMDGDSQSAATARAMAAAIVDAEIGARR